jgi:hypothetical protein
MNEKEINQYIKAHQSSVDIAIRAIRGKISYEEAEDAMQELLITMFKCLLNYNPKLGPLENYINKSVANRASSFVRDINAGHRGIERRAQSLSTSSENKIPLIDLIEDGRGDFTDRLGAGELVENVLVKINEPTAGMLRLWANNHALKYISDVYGSYIGLTDYRIKSGLAKMKKIIEGTN